MSTHKKKNKWQVFSLSRFVSTLAEIGGYVGLLLGVSFFHLASLANRFIDRKIREMKGDPVGGRATKADEEVWAIRKNFWS